MIFLRDLSRIAVIEVLDVVEAVAVLESVVAARLGAAARPSAGPLDPTQQKLFPTRFGRHVCKFFILEVEFLRLEDGLDVAKLYEIEVKVVRVALVDPVGDENLLVLEVEQGVDWSAFQRVNFSDCAGVQLDGVGEVRQHHVQ